MPHVYSFPTRRSSDLVNLQVVRYLENSEHLIRSRVSELLIHRARNETLQRHIAVLRSEEHTSEFQSRQYIVCRLLLEKINTIKFKIISDTFRSVIRTN